jgi:hypothetical protein
MSYVALPTDLTGVARVRGGDLDATVLQWEGRWVTLLTTRRRGRPVALAVEVGPALDEDQSATEARLTRRLREWTKVLPIDSPALTSTALKALPLGAFMRARAEMARDAPGAGLNPWGDPPLTAESRTLAVLADALIYVQAAEQGIPPAEAIAAAWGITRRTAEGRITRARAKELLTPVSGNQERSTLTEQALSYPKDQIAQHLPHALQRVWAQKVASKLREAGED